MVREWLSDHTNVAFHRRAIVAIDQTVLHCRAHVPTPHLVFLFVYNGGLGTSDRQQASIVASVHNKPCRLCNVRTGEWEDVRVLRRDDVLSGLVV